jgi:hypothetical protein
MKSNRLLFVNVPSCNGLLRPAGLSLMKRNDLPFINAAFGGLAWPPGPPRSYGRSPGLGLRIGERIGQELERKTVQAFHRQGVEEGANGGAEFVVCETHRGLPC